MNKVILMGNFKAHVEAPTVARMPLAGLLRI